MKTGKAKRRIAAVIGILILIAVAFFLVRGLAGGQDLFDVELTSNTDAITLTWENVDGAGQYAILRADITEGIIQGDEDAAYEDYETIATLEADETTYIDKQVKPGRCYAYIVEAGKSGSTGGRPAATTWTEGITTYQAAGLFQPDLINMGYGESYTNSPHKLYLYSQTYVGIQPEGVELERREAGDRFRAIEYKLPEGAESWDGVVLLDDSVSPGTVYEYRARTTANNNGKALHSDWSRILRIPAVNFEGTFTVKNVVVEGETLTFALTSAKDNGVLIFLPDCEAFFGTEEAPDSDELADEDRQTAALQEMSADGKSFVPLSDKGMTLAAGKTVYLRFTVPEGTPSTLTIQGGNAEYDGPGNGETILTLDLTKGQGTVYCEWD